MAFGNATKGYVKTHSGGGGSGGTKDYEALSNKPSINGVTLSGNKTSSDLNITASHTLTHLTTDGLVNSTIDLSEASNNDIVYFCGSTNDPRYSCCTIPISFIKAQSVITVYLGQLIVNLNVNQTDGLILTISFNNNNAAILTDIYY